MHGCSSSGFYHRIETGSGYNLSQTFIQAWKPNIASVATLASAPLQTFIWDSPGPPVGDGDPAFRPNVLCTVYCVLCTVYCVLYTV